MEDAQHPIESYPFLLRQNEGTQLTWCLVHFLRHLSLWEITPSEGFPTIDCPTATNLMLSGGVLSLLQGEQYMSHDCAESKVYLLHLSSVQACIQ